MNNPIEIYRSQDGSIQLNVKLENETVWLSANQMAILSEALTIDLIDAIDIANMNNFGDSIGFCDNLMKLFLWLIYRLVNFKRLCYNRLC